ncbi:MAG: hypothetical protein IK080_04030 [Clostridia bacterium]|nr:hypothetical protein [Clostridia bacterium]
MNRLLSLLLTAITVFSGLCSLYRPAPPAAFSADCPAEERNMEYYRGVHSYVADCGGVPTLFINGEATPAAAYMTYLEEYNDYDAFVDAGYRLFSVPVLFAGRWINANDSCKPFHGGIFDREGAADFSTLDASVARILSACPDAYIFPRLNLSMPLWWIAAHPDCTDGTGKRELLFTDAYRETAAEMLRAVIDHINESAYAPRIVGYQIAGGNTEEWFHFDLNAGCCANAAGAFQAYLETYYPACTDFSLPDLSLLQGKGPYHKNAQLARYLEFANNAVAETICRLCSAAKHATGGNVVIGTFYGYSLEVSSPLYGTHALKTILACENIDFICSPNSYIDTRDPDTDWTEMYPADSVRLHGKLCMQECDIRTHLTRLLSEAAPEYDSENRYNAPIWHGLESKAQSVSMLRKAFSRQLIKGNGFWWFDMWGGWYHDPDLLAELRQMREIYAASLTESDRAGTAELAVFVDESAYPHMTDCALRSAAFNQRRALGALGAPYDLYDVSDFAAVCRNYKAVLFLSELKTQAMQDALARCKADRIPYLSVSNLKKGYSASELRAFCAAHGVHIFCDTDDLVYINKHFLAIHATEAGEKTVTLDGVYAFRELLTETGLQGTGAALRIPMQANETRLFALEAQE